MERVAEHNDLAAAERLFSLLFDETELSVDHVKEVGGDHGNFVNNYGVKLADNVGLFVVDVSDFFLVETVLEGGFELKERMDGKAAYVDGGDTGRGDNGNVFLSMSDKIRE